MSFLPLGKRSARLSAAVQYCCFVTDALPACCFGPPLTAMTPADHRHSPTLVAHTVDKYGIRLFVGCLLEGTAASPSSAGGTSGGAGSGAGGASAKVQTAALNLINLTLAQPDLSTRARASLAEERGLLPGLIALMDHSMPLLRAKAVVTVMLLSR